MTVGLLITTYNRPAYLKESLDSLRRADLSQVNEILIVDDNSNDLQTIAEIQYFEEEFPNCRVVYKKRREGIKDSLTTGYMYLFENCDWIINLDGDAVVRNDFIEVLLKLKTQFPGHVISGFNTMVENRNPVVKEEEDFFFKKYFSGINICIDVDQYKDWIFPALTKEGNWDFEGSKLMGIPAIVSKPSVVQHIGVVSSMGHTNNGVLPDVAEDFIGINLPNVTLFGINHINPEGLEYAAALCRANIRFGKECIITKQLFNGHAGYSEFCIKELPSWIGTNFVLKIEADGYVQNWRAWRPEFLKYDYIGATWCYKDNMNVGNGGFSMRSRSLMTIAAGMINEDFHPEDDRICRRYRKRIEHLGIRFAPEEVANRFSIESYGVHKDFRGGNVYGGQFGFHGFNVVGLPYPPSHKKIRT